MAYNYIHKKINRYVLEPRLESCQIEGPTFDSYTIFEGKNDRWYIMVNFLKFTNKQTPPM